MPSTELRGHTAWFTALTASSSPAAGFDNVVKIWDPATWKEVRSLIDHTGPVYCVVYSKDGSTIATSGPG